MKHQASFIVLLLLVAVVIISTSGRPITEEEEKEEEPDQQQQRRGTYVNLLINRNYINTRRCLIFCVHLYTIIDGGGGGGLPGLSSRSPRQLIPNLIGASGRVIADLFNPYYYNNYYWNNIRRHRYYGRRPLIGLGRQTVYDGAYYYPSYPSSYYYDNPQVDVDVDVDVTDDYPGGGGYDDDIGIDSADDSYSTDGGGGDYY